MATTPNYGWVTPAPTDYVVDLPADFETFADAVDDTVKDLNPGTTAGDIDYYTSSTAKARVGIGTAGQVLAVNSGATAPEWQNLPTPTGINWTIRQNAGQLGFNNIYSLKYVNNKWIMAGSGLATNQARIAHSSDGITWTAVDTGAANPAFDIHWSPLTSLWISVGGASTIYTSPDLITWTSRTSNFSGDDINAITENSSIIVVTGTSGKIASSTNGTTWTLRTSNVTGTLAQVVWFSSAGRFVAVANSTTASQGATSSTNGTSWTAASTTNALRGIIVANNTLFGFSTAMPAFGSYTTDGTTWTSLSNVKFGGIAKTDRRILANYPTNQILAWSEQSLSNASSGDLLLIDAANLYSNRITYKVLQAAPFKSYGSTDAQGSLATNGSEIMIVENNGTIATSF